MGKLRALCALLGDPRRRERALSVRNVRLLVRSVRSAKRKQRVLAMSALRPLAAQLAAEIGGCSGVEALLQLVAGVGDREEKKLAWKVLSRLTDGEGEQFEKNRERLEVAGGLELLASSDEDEEGAERKEQEREGSSTAETQECGGYDELNDAEDENRASIVEDIGGTQPTQGEEATNEDPRHFEQHPVAVIEDTSSSQPYQGEKLSSTGKDSSHDQPPISAGKEAGTPPEQVGSSFRPNNDSDLLTVQNAITVVKHGGDYRRAMSALLEFEDDDEMAVEIGSRDTVRLIREDLVDGIISDVEARVLALKTLCRLARLSDCRVQLQQQVFFEYLVKRVLQAGSDEKLAVVELVTTLTADEADHQTSIVEAGGVEAVAMLFQSIKPKLVLRSLKLFQSLVSNQVARTSMKQQTTVSSLITLLTHEDVVIVQNAGEILRTLIAYPDVGLAIASSGAILTVLKLLQCESETKRDISNMVLRALALQNDDEKLRVDYVILTLITTIRYLLDPVVKMSSVIRLRELALTPSNRPLIIQSGGIEVLVSLSREFNYDASESTLELLVLNDPSMAEKYGSKIIPAAVMLAQAKLFPRRLKAVTLLNKLADSDTNRITIGEAGGVSTLIGFLRHLSHSGTDDQCVHVINLLDKLAHHNRNLVYFGRSGGIELFTTLFHGRRCSSLRVAVVRSLTYALVHMGGTLSIAKQAVFSAFTDTLRSKGLEMSIKLAVIEGLASLSTNRIFRSEIVERDGVPIVSAHLDSDSPTVLLETLRALRSMEQPICRFGGIPKLIDIVKGKGSQELKHEALSTLQVLAGTIRDRRAICDAGGVPLIVNLVQRGTDDEKKEAIGILQNLALCSQVSRAIIDAQGIEILSWVKARGTPDLKELASNTLLNLGRHASAAVEIEIVDEVFKAVDITAKTQNGAQQPVSQEPLEMLAKDVCGYLEKLQFRALSAVFHLIRHGENAEQKCAAIALQLFAESNKLVGKIPLVGGVEVLIRMLGRGSDFGQKKPASLAYAALFSGSAPNAVAAARDGFEHLVEQLSNSNDRTVLRAARALSAQSRSEKNRTGINAAGGIPALVKLLRSSSSVHKVNAARALWNISVEINLQAAVIESGCVEALFALLREADDHVMAAALGAIKALARIGSSMSAIITAGGVPQLIELTRSGTSDQGTIALKVLRSIVTSKVMIAGIVAAGGVPVFVDAISSDIAARRAAGVQALRLLAGKKESHAPIIAAGGLAALKQLMSSGTDHERSTAEAILRIVKGDISGAPDLNSTTRKPSHPRAETASDQQQQATHTSKRQKTGSSTTCA